MGASTSPAPATADGAGGAAAVGAAIATFSPEVACLRDTAWRIEAMNSKQNTVQDSATATPKEQLNCQPPLHVLV